MLLTDTHTHLYLPDFKDDIDTVINSASGLGVQRIFLPNIDSTTIDDLLGLVQSYPNICFPMMGLHPCSVKEDYKEELDIVVKQLDSGDYCAVGEIGIDLHWDKTFFSQQQEAFRSQIELAKQMGLPIVIHSRNSFEEIFEIIDELNNDQLSGIFHCFSGTLEQANKIIDYGGFKLGIGGVVTFKNSGLDKVVEQIELEHLVLETDSPYLAPVPFRGKRNETPYIIHIAEKVAELHNVDIAVVAEITTANSKEIFKI